jgi:hypothetical protein
VAIGDYPIGSITWGPPGTTPFPNTTSPDGWYPQSLPPAQRVIYELGYEERQLLRELFAAIRDRYQPIAKPAPKPKPRKPKPKKRK